RAWVLELISCAETSVAGNRGHALGEGIEPAIGSSTPSAAVLGAPRSGVRSDSRYQQGRKRSCDDRDLAHERLLGLAAAPHLGLERVGDRSVNLSSVLDLAMRELVVRSHPSTSVGGSSSVPQTPTPTLIGASLGMRPDDRI